jgi:hypothetical protein
MANMCIPVTLNSYVIKVPLKRAKCSLPVAARLQSRASSQSTRKEHLAASALGCLRKERLAASALAAVSAAAAAHNARVTEKNEHATMMKNQNTDYLSSTIDRRLQARPFPFNSITFPSSKIIIC